MYGQGLSLNVLATIIVELALSTTVGLEFQSGWRWAALAVPRRRMEAPSVIATGST
jgi:hypothetical protein